MRLFRLLTMRLGVAGLLAGLGTAAVAAPMALIDPNLPGTKQYDGWLSGSLTTAANPGFPAFPGSGAWPGPIGSSAPGSGDANLNKGANGPGGGPFPAGGSLYYGGFSSTINTNGGAMSVTDASPVAGLENLAFQIQIGEAWTYDFWDEDLPTLSYNGGSQALVPDDSELLEQFFNGTVTMPTGEENVYINTHLLRWDLSGIGDGPVTSFAISFNGVQHAQVYALRVDQSDEIAAVPEPGALVLAGLSALGLIVGRRWRRVVR